MISSPILLFLTEEDTNYLTFLKPFLQGRQVFFITQTPKSIEEIELYTKTKGIKFIISTSVIVLNKVVASQKHQNLDDWAGSLYERSGITYLFLNQLKQFFTVPYGKFIVEHYLSKIIKPETWPKTPEFTWAILTPETVEEAFQILKNLGQVAAVDIETTSFEDITTKEYETIIDCVCYTVLTTSNHIHTFVIPISYAPLDQLEFWIIWMRKFNSLPIPKIFQNGLYDTGHMLATYNAPVTNYLFDTQSLFHSWYSELPKRLDFISAFSIHSSYYWKDLASVGGPQGRMEYNAKDGWATMVSFLYLISKMPDWAIRNYYIKFPLWVPCCYCNLEGVKINANKREELITEYKSSFESTLHKLQHVFGENFNPKSPKQVTDLIHFYGSPDISSSGASDLDKFALRHPINARFAGQILKTRETAKILSTYLKPQDFSTAVTKTKKKSYLLRYGRMFYALGPDRTDTGRLGCSESIWWVGSQVQNQPEEVKGMWEADDGFELFEADNETSESYATGFVSGDINLLDTLHSGRDFHATNAERFFGIPYDEIVRTEAGIKKISNKAIRDLSKRTNHGATYDMMWFTLLKTMGEENVDKAKELLHLPSFWNRRKVCEYLLEAFDKAYPSVRTNWYNSVVSVASTMHMLTSALGWTRYCFGNPAKNKREKDSLIAHIPQNLSVGIINEGFKEIFWKVVIPNQGKDIRIKAQIHDSILGQVRLGHRHLLKEVHKLMVRPTKVIDMVKGKERVMTIPVSMKVGKNWLEMETLEMDKI